MTTEAQQQEYFGRDLEAMSFALNYHRWILDEFRAYTGREIVEVGAGTGNFTALLLTAAPSSHLALEPAANVFTRLEERFRAVLQVRAVHGTFADLKAIPVGAIDTVFYVNVLEHIRDDLEELRRAHEALKSGGHLCVFVPALGWLYGTADEAFGHYRRYSRRALKQVVTAAGFDILRLHYFDLTGVLPWFVLFRVLKRSCFTAGQARLYDKLVVPIIRQIESAVRPPLGENLLLVARKR